MCTTHPLTPVSTSFLFVFDTEWVMSVGFEADLTYGKLIPGTNTNGVGSWEPIGG